MAEHVVNPQATSYLPADARDAIQGVDQLDRQTLQMSNIDMKVVEFVVRNRRLKIESDFKVSRSFMVVPIICVNLFMTENNFDSSNTLGGNQ